MADGSSSSSLDELVGREREIALLGKALDDALSGRGSVRLLEGDPGIGKSKLADSFAREAQAAGANVLWGRCWEAGGAPAYWPWIQALRTHVRNSRAETLAEELNGVGRDLVGILPEIGDVLGVEPGPQGSDPDAARFRLFDAVSRFLERIARDRPVLVVLDDLHVADEPSLLMLRFVADGIHRSRIVFVGALRTPDVHQAPAIRHLLAELLRNPAIHRMTLTGLSDEAIARLIEMRTETTPSEALVRSISEETGGNALLVREIATLLTSADAVRAAEQRKLPLSAGIREATERRMDHLSETCRETLLLAAVCGREFGIETLSRVATADTDSLLEVLDEAESAGIIAEVPGTIGRLRFSHALVRDAIYGSVPTSRRMKLHLEVGASLAAAYADDIAPHLSEIAHHYLRAAPAGGAAEAVHYARAAAARAERLLAYEEAARLIGSALRALDHLDASDRRTRGELMAELGDSHLKAGDEEAAKDAFLRAAEISREIGAADVLARAALGYGGRYVWTRPGQDMRVIPLLEEAIAALRNADPVLRARLLARLAGALRDQPVRARRAALTREAIELARAAGDDPTLAYALASHFAANWGPENADEQLTIATELVGLAEAIGDPDRAIEAHLVRHKALMQLCDVTGARADLEIAARLAERSRQPAHLWFVAVDRVTTALFEGRFADAERTAPETLELGRQAQSLDADVSYRLHLFALRREQGRLDEVEDLIRRSVGDYPGYPMFRCVLANLFACTGANERARALLDGLSERRFTALPRDNEWLFSMCLLPEVTDALGDGDRASILYEELKPFAHLHAYSAPELGLGSAARYVGLCALTMGRLDEAIAHLERGRDANEAMGAHPWVAYALFDLARAHLERNTAGDARTARSLLAACLDLSGRLGMLALEMKVISLQHRVGTGRVANEFLREGDYWSISFGDDAFRLRDSKGLAYLRRLLAEPGREVHAVELVAGAPNAEARIRERTGAHAEASAGAVLDARAVSEYRRRLAELDEDIDEARRWGDSERAARAEQERDFLARELARAVGLGGRPRRSADPVERARISVTKAIRTAMSRIGENSPALRSHLDATLRTGTYCSYRPDPRVPVTWRVS